VLRELAGVEQHDFIHQLCGEQALRLLSPPGHSDGMFFLSSDERFLVRTISCAEKKQLLAVLQRYAEHLRRWVVILFFASVLFVWCCWVGAVGVGAAAGRGAPAQVGAVCDWRVCGF
jgi:hypothetical protein